MKLGIFVNTDKHIDHVLGLTKAALDKGHEVIIFNMDDGTKVLGNPGFTGLCTTPGVTMSFCDHSAKGLEVTTDGIPEDVVCGSQYNNAVMNHDADRVIIL